MLSLDGLLDNKVWSFHLDCFWLVLILLQWRRGSSNDRLPYRSTGQFAACCTLLLDPSSRSSDQSLTAQFTSCLVLLRADPRANWRLLLFSCLWSTSCRSSGRHSIYLLEPIFCWPSLHLPPRAVLLLAVSSATSTCRSSGLQTNLNIRQR